MAKKTKPSWIQKYQRRKQNQDRTQIKTGEKKLLDRITRHGERETVIVESKERMSDVLDDFIEPYQEFAHNEEDLRKLYSLAIIAWNMALLPTEKRRSSLEDMIKTLSTQTQFQKDLFSIFEDLIERKETHFAGNTRKILDYELTKVSDGYHLSVVSTLDPDALAG